MIRKMATQVSILDRKVAIQKHMETSERLESACQDAVNIGQGYVFIAVALEMSFILSVLQWSFHTMILANRYLRSHIGLVLGLIRSRVLYVYVTSLS